MRDYVCASRRAAPVVFLLRANITRVERHACGLTDTHATRPRFLMTTSVLPSYEGCSPPVTMRAKNGVTEEVMRSLVVAIGTAALALGLLAQPAAAKKSKMGCEVGKEIWNADQGKCVPGKYTRKSAKKSKKAE
jgi:hypothetical protein